MDEQLRHYQNKLAFEIDSWDLKVAQEAGENIVVIDARSPPGISKTTYPRCNKYTAQEHEPRND